MAAPEPLYDLVLLLDTSAPEDQRKKVLSDAQSAISSSGTIVSDVDWGTRALAYEIRHRTDAEYHLLQFHGPAALLANLQRTLRIADGVVRFRIIKLAPGTPAPTELPRAEAPAAPPAPAATAPAPAETSEPAAEAEAAAAEPAAAAAPAAAPAAEPAEAPSAA
jgi:small subunit ribosomal protein S6